MQQANNTEDTLRQLDSQQQPDLSQLDEHWQAMQAMLQPDSYPVKKSISAKSIAGGTIIGLLMLAGGAFLYDSMSKNGDNRNGNNKEPNNTGIFENKTEVVPVKQDSGSHQQASPQSITAVSKITQTANFTNNSSYNRFTDEDTLFSTMKINYEPFTTCPGKIDSANNAVNKVQLLKDLFTQLEKQEQHFTIDNSRDTLIQCAEGSVILIPAKSFNGEKGIQFSVKEFYKNSDIVLNQLTTLSNKEQLISGGMFELKATLNGKEVAIDPLKPIKLYTTDTSSNMNEMQLFNGEEKNISEKKTVNWVAQPQYFNNKKMVTQVRVLNLVNMPYNIKEKKDGQVAYFLIDDSIAISKDAIRESLKKNYGYNKVKLRNADWWESHERRSVLSYFNSYYATRIGDSIWMNKDIADKNKLIGTATRMVAENDYPYYRGYLNYGIEGNSFFNEPNQFSPILKNKYSIDVTRLGWINCDKFYKDNRKKIEYTVNLGDSAKNYQTMLVFDRIKSVMNGYAVGNKVIFNDIPEGEKVKLVSIGIDNTGKAVFAVQPATISTTELTGIQFESTSAPELKTSLSKIDR